jgi:hypothetical protein
MERRAFSRGELMFLIGVPLAWAVLLLFHPGGEGEDVYADLHDVVTRFLVVHVGMMLFIPLMGVAVYLLVRGLDGTAALVSRIGLVLFVLFYTLWEALYGIGTGILANEVNALPEEERPAGAELLQDYSEYFLIRNLGVFGLIGTIGFITAMIAAGIALRDRAGAPVFVVVLLGVSGLLITAHPPPYGPIGLLLFVVAVWLLIRSQAADREHAPLGQAGPA